MGLFKQLFELLTADHRWERVKFVFTVSLQDPTLFPLDVHPAFDVELCERMLILY